MHLHFERTVNARSDCPILSLTWMGKVPDELPEDEGWKLNRNNYYQEGWLATGNVRGIVGVTFTTSHCKKNVDFPLRTNYNLRGHRSEVILVKWNEPYQKLASCDSSGIIFVWIKYEGRWSIELINDRNTPVTHFSWSHDGRMALICYQDGFVLVGSVAGQRYWSSMLNLDSTISCGIWTPDDQQVYFGTNSGQIIVMDVHGAMVSQVQLSGDVGISSMAWSCEKFKMEEGEDECSASSGEKKFILAVALQNGYIYLLSTFDDVAPIHINTGLQGPVCMEWSNSRELLAVAGIILKSPTETEYTNMLKFYTDKGVLLYQTQIPDTHAKVSTLTWGHNDKRLFLATGTQIHIAWVAKRIASLQLLCRLRIYNLLHNEVMLASLPLPLRLRNIIGNLFAQTIRCCVPEPSALREFVSRPPSGSVRLHCTMIRHDEDCNISSGTCYTLYLEYLGGLVPLLKGKRTSKIRPEFVIFDPQLEDLQVQHQYLSADAKSSSSSSASTANASGGVSDTSESEKEEGCTASPRMQRKKKRKHKNERTTTWHYRADFETEQDDLSYVDTLPEQVRLVEVTSNIWGTKFKIHGLASVVPANLGQVTYKTSLLHLQPRQMTLVITELRDDFPVGPDPSFNPNLFSEDEEEQMVGMQENKSKCTRVGIDNCPPIAPMSPRTSALTRQKSYLTPESLCSYSNSVETSREDKCSFVEIEDRDHVRPQNLLRPTNSQNSTSFIGPLGKTSSQNQKHAISPICCEVSVPALQSPKNAVAPSDIIFDRPSAPTIISYSSNSTATLQVKPSLIDQHTNKNDISVSFNINSGDQKPIALRKQVQTPISEACSSRGHAKLGNKREEDCNKSGSVEEKIRLPPMFVSAGIMTRSCSVGYLDMVDAQMVPPSFRLSGLNRGDNPSKRLILVNSHKDANKRRQSRLRQRSNAKMSCQLKNFGKSKSLDSSDIFHNATNSPSFVLKEKKIPEQIEPSEVVKAGKEAKTPQNVQDLNVTNNNNNSSGQIRRGSKSPNNNSRMTAKEFFSSPLMRRRKNKNTASERGKSKADNNESSSESNGVPIHTQALVNLEKLINRLREDDSSSRCMSPKLPRSSPSSPAPAKKGLRPQSASPIRRRIMNSPFLRRKYKNCQESSDDEVNASGDEIFNGTNYKDLETFQKSQLRQKLKRGKIEPNGGSCCNNSQSVPQRREFVMHNKAPMWNENSQVYQLDFGGRVTQESAKNFQIEFRGKQVMQFGRIDGNAYTLDFQYPFSALQAFAVALANVTQRLK